MRDLYKQSGVNVEAGYESVQNIKKHIDRTKRPEVMGGLGAFAGAFDISKLPFKEPVLLSGTDGVGTKLKLAFQMNQHNTVGVDLVGMCVNDIIAQGAEPLFFLDYIACGKNIPQQIEEIVSGIAEGCAQAGCSLIGGETAEMPGMYDEGEYDLAGFVVGAAEKSELISGETIKPGDRVIGIASSGIHSNGYSLVRKIIEDKNLELGTQYPGLQKSLGETLLTPTKIYVKAIQSVKQSIKGVAHVTGGGFYENIPRTLPESYGVQIKNNSWDIPAIFPFLQEQGGITQEEMFGVFNMGIGMAIVVAPEDVSTVLEGLNESGEVAWHIGEVTSNPGVTFINE